MDDTDVDSLGIKALKELIAAAGLSTTDCVDKDDLRARAREALAKKKQSAATSASASASPSTQTAQRQLGGYQCIVDGPADLLAGDPTAKPADLLIVGLHGLGASNTDLASVPQMLRNLEARLGRSRIVGVFPQAPSGAMGMPAWWEFDVQSFMAAQMAAPAQKEQMIATLIRKKPPGLDACRAQMRALVTEARKLAGGAGPPLPASQWLQAGFSLGAITSIDVALQCEAGEGPGGVLVMNGAPIVVDEWSANLQSKHKGIRVHLTSGRMDMTLPHEATGWVVQLLEGFGAKVSKQFHNGGHEIGGHEVLASIATFALGTLPDEDDKSKEPAAVS